MRFGEKGSVGLTTQKIILAVVLLLLLALVVYGYITGGFVPLKEKFVGAYDELTLLLASWTGNSPTDKDCKVVSLKDYSIESDDLLTLFKVEDGYGSTFTVCPGRVCSIVLGKNEFKLDKGRFYISFSSHLSPADEWVFNSTYSVEDLLFYRDLYESSVEFLLESQNKASVRGGKEGNDYSSEDLRILTGEGIERFNLMAYLDLDKITSFKAYANWEQGKWEVKDLDKEIVVYVGEDYNQALDSFYPIVQGNWFSWSRWFDMEVRSNIGTAQKTIREIVGGRNNQLDSKDELAKLKTFFVEFSNKEIKESKPSEEDFNHLVNLTQGKNLVAGNKTFSLSVESLGDYPILKMSSGEEVYGLSFSSNLGVWHFADSTPLGLFKYSEGKWTLIDEKNFYKITSEKFEEIMAFNKVYDFLEERC